MSEPQPAPDPSSHIVTENKGDVEAMITAQIGQSAIGEVVGKKEEHTTTVHNYRERLPWLMSLAMLLVGLAVGPLIDRLSSPASPTPQPVQTTPPIGVANNPALSCAPDATPPAPAANSPLPAEARLALSFDPPQGNWLTDSSPHGAHAWRFGSFGEGEPGHAGSGLYFDGASLVCVPNTAALQIRSAITIDLWVQPAVIDNKTRNLVAKFAVNAPSSYRLYLRNGYPAFWLADPQSGIAVESPFQLEAGRWHHLVARYDGARLTISVDGQETAVDHRGSIPVTPIWLEIGSTPFRNEFFIGTIDELVISGR